MSHSNPGLEAAWKRSVEAAIGKVLDGLAGSYSTVLPDNEIVEMVTRQMKRALKEAK